MKFGLDEDVEFKKYFLPKFFIQKRWQKKSIYLLTMSPCLARVNNQPQLKNLFCTVEFAFRVEQSQHSKIHSNWAQHSANYDI
jgi:hypothetical protein